jgi:hypothetical protein
VVTKAAWDRWWRSTGNRDLTLLLWAAWNPIGTCPLDEYESYSPMVASMLRQAHEADMPLAEQADDDDVQRERNQLSAQAVERLAAALAEVRTVQMGLPSDTTADQRAASILLDWHEWSMMDLDVLD